jgi:hypothetical protein
MEIAVSLFQISHRSHSWRDRRKKIESRHRHAKRHFNFSKRISPKRTADVPARGPCSMANKFVMECRVFHFLVLTENVSVNRERLLTVLSMITMLRFSDSKVRRATSP